MSDEPFATEAGLNAIESALGSLVPAGGPIDRDAILFRAGQAAARPGAAGRRAWQGLAASLALVALGEAALLAHRPPPTVVERVVVVRVPTPTPSPTVVIPERAVVREPERRPDEGMLAMGQTAYSRLAGQVMRYGLDGLPASPAGVGMISRAGPASSGRMLQEELRKLREPGEPL